MLSRAAESIYWMSRYVERAESIARLIEVHLTLTLDQPPEERQWNPLIDISGDDVEFLERYGHPTQDAVLHFLTFDLENPNSVLACLRSARENARSVREIISSEMWESINAQYLGVLDATRTTVDREDAHDFYKNIRMFGHLAEGLAAGSMSHGEGWHFARLGRLIERADKTSRILDVKYFVLLPSPEHVGSPVDDIQWSAVLKSASAFEMYRKKYGRIFPARVVEFLLLDREFPRAVLSCMTRAAESLHAITGTPIGSFRNRAEQQLGRLRAELEYSDSKALIAKGLHEYLDELQGKLNGVDDDIFETFFARRPVFRT